MKDTKIEWCDHSWSPWEGCTKISTGCAHCYAAARNHRFGDNWGPGKPRRLTVDWKKPTRWNKAGVCINCGFIQSRAGKEPHQTKGGSGVCGQPKDGIIVQTFRRPSVFPSLCDWLDEEVPIEWLARFLALIAQTPNLDWLLLTKRPENWLERMARVQSTHPCGDWSQKWLDDWFGGHAPSNVWIGTSVEDQANADRRIPELLKIPARLRFLSVEPMLGPVDLSGTRGSNNGMGLCWDWTGNPIHVPHCDYTAVGKTPPNGPSIDWVIVGGESGPGARACNVAWIRDIVRQCAAAGTACFVKQFGAHVCTDNANMDDWPDDATLIGEGEGFAAARAILKHPKGGDPAEWPEDLRVRQMPEVKS